ncbi:MAG: hypothetical protein JJT89_17695, partial [Nitriliruptoraceae bacterium]|nr:hypothetical protein [Nitriliruptoraceae bacterium]
MADVEEPSGPDPPDPPGDAEAAALPAGGAAAHPALGGAPAATQRAGAHQGPGAAEEGVAPGLDLVRTTASARLVGRRARVRAATLLSAPVSWGPIAAALAARGPLPAALAALVHPTPQGDDARSDATPVTSEATGDDGTRPDPASRTPATADPALRDRLRATRLDRDEWRRRAQGADARTDQLRADLELARRTLAERDERIAALEDELAQAGAALERDRARERRRAAGDRAALEQDLREARRLLEDERREHRRAL